MIECSCCGRDSNSRLVVAGRHVQLLGLPALLTQYHDNGGCPEQLYNTLRVYNSIPKELEDEYRQAVMQAFADYCSTAEGDGPAT